jgi:Host cell surface-exposed lipoprotein
MIGPLSIAFIGYGMLYVAAAVAQDLSGPQKAVAQDLSGPQKNAVRSAESYLSMQGFSRQGLIDQLSSPYGNAYDVADATAAVDSLDVDWNAQAVRSAKQYLQMTGFSCKGLIEQLSSEYGNQYSVGEATYGAKEAGAC